MPSLTAQSILSLIATLALVCGLVLPPVWGYVAVYPTIVLFLGLGIGVAIRDPSALHSPAMLLVWAALLLILLATVLAGPVPDDWLGVLIIAILLLSLGGPGIALWSPSTISPVRVATFALVGAGLGGVLGLVEWAGTGQRAGLGNNPIHYSGMVTVLGFAALSGIVATRSRWRVLYLFGPLAAFVAAAISGSRGPLLASVMLSVIAGVLLVWWHRRERRMLIALFAWGVAGLLLAGLFAADSRALNGIIALISDPDAFAQGSSNQIRLGLYAGGLAAFQDSPVWGHGYGDLMNAVFVHLSPTALYERFDHLHGDLIDFAVVGGVLGVGSYVLILVAPLAILRRRRHYKRATVLLALMLTSAFLLLGLTNAMIGVLPQTVLFAVLLGCVTAQKDAPARTSDAIDGGTVRRFETIGENMSASPQRTPNEATLETLVSNAAPAKMFIELSKARRKDRSLDEAEAAALAGLSLYPGHPQLQAQTAEVLMSRGDWTAAAAAWSALIAEWPLDTNAGWVARHLKAVRSADATDDARRLAEQAEVSGADHPGLHQEVAMTWMACGDWARASLAWQRAIRGSDAPRLALFTGWSEAEAAQGNFAEAARVLDAAMAALPDSDAGALHTRKHRLALDEKIAEGSVPDHRVYLAGSGAPATAEGMNIETVCGAFWDMERELALLDWTVHGVNAWPLIRMRVYYKTVQLLDLFTTPHPAAREQSQQFTNSEVAAARDSLEAAEREANDGGGLGQLLKGLAQPKQELRALLLATRKVDNDEPYSAALRAELGPDSLLIDRPFLGALLPGALNLNALNFVMGSKYCNPAHSVLDVSALAMCQTIRAYIARVLGVDVGDLSAAVQRRVASFAAIRRGATILFSSEKITHLYMTYGYGANNQAMIAGAQDIGARVTEIQHGFISRLHLGYSWPGAPSVPHTPNELWCFGDFWWQSTPLAAGVTPRTIGAPYVQKLASAHAGERHSNRIVFTSQGVIGPRLFEVARETARRRPDREIIFRLHPNESLDAYEAFPGDRPANFLISHRTPNIFSLLASAEVQVGVFSTTLFEGIALGTRTIVFDMPGVEYMRPAIETGDVLLVRNVDELVVGLDRAPLARTPEFYYAKPADRLL